MGHFQNDSSPCVTQSVQELDIWSTVDFIPPWMVYVVAATQLPRNASKQTCAAMGPGGALAIMSTVADLELLMVSLPPFQQKCIEKI